MGAMTGHTPGPWFLDENNHVYSRPFYRNAPFTDTDGKTHDDWHDGLVALPYGCGDAPAEANARLIAAAPALKEALEKLLAGLLNEPRYRDHADTHAARAALRLVDMGE